MTDDGFKHSRDLGRDLYGCEVMTSPKFKELVKLIPHSKAHGIVLSIYDLELLLEGLKSQQT